jgi:hypothetical protein
MRINEHRKKGCDKAMNFKRNPFKLKLYPPSRNTMEGVYLVKGGNILEYKAKANALSKPRNSCLSTTLVLQLIRHLNTSVRRKTPCPWRFVMKFKKNSLLFVKNASQNMEAKQSNKFQN